MDEFQYTAAVEEIGALFERWQQELSGRTDYEKEKFVYEYLIETCRYDEYAAHAGSCYGALIEGVARCEGYSKSFMWAMWALDIPCMTVTGEAANGDAFLYSRHSWNIVQIDGTYCYLDATYDDVEQDGEQFPISYGFFNVDQNSVERSRETDALYLRLGVPDCASMDNSFHVKNRSYLRSGGQAAKMLSELLGRAVTSGEDRVYLKTETDEQFSELVNSIDTLLEAWPVSYTHLDVYKRQVRYRVGPGTGLPAFQRSVYAGHEMVCRALPAGDGHGGDRDARRCSGL